MKNFLVVLTVFATLSSYAVTAKKTKKVQAQPTVVAPAAPVNVPPATTAVVPETVESNIAASSSTSVTTSQAKGAITGTVDLRPSYGSKVGEVHTENWVDLGYKFNDTYHLIYEQDFNTSLSKSPSAFSEGAFTLQHGFFRGRVTNVWESTDKVYSLSYELRPYLPTLKTARDAGMITIVRNYAKFAAKVSNALTLSVWEVPVLHAYDRAGNGAKANPWFENRAYLLADWTITDKWTLSANLILCSSKYRAFGADLVNSGKWGHFLYTYPELDYAIAANYTVGLSYYSDNFVKADFSDLTLGNAFENGVTQLVFRATL